MILIRSIVAGSATGAIFLHGYNIGHNDIKPQNVIIFPGKAGTGPVAKLVDLGLALGERAGFFLSLRIESARGEGGVYSVHSLPQLYGRRPSHPYTKPG